MSQAGILQDQTTSLADIETITGNSGGAVGPDGGGNIDFVGDNTQGINIVGTPASNLLTVSGINATTSQIGVSEFADGPETTTGTDGTRSVTPLGLASKLGSQTANGLAYGNGTTNAIQWLAEATDGQIPIGSTGNPPVLSTLTAGVGVSIVNAAGSITISADQTVNGQVQTVGAVTGDVITLGLGGSTAVYTLEARVSGLETGTPAGAGFQIFGTVRTDGASATLVGIPDVVSNAEAALQGTDATIIVSGNDAIIQVTGDTGLTIDWEADLQYTLRS